MKKDKKVLVVATVVQKHIMQFHIPTLKMLKEMGYRTYVAARNDYENPNDCDIPYCDKYYDIKFSRSPFSTENIKAYKQLKNIIEIEHFDVIHCHTPVGGVLARLAAKNARKRGTKVIYTAHGFHFYKGAPIKNWILYYPVEKHMSRYTDVLITINNEDYDIAKNKFKAKKVKYIKGVGIDINRYKNDSNNNEKLNNEFDIQEKDVVLLTVGELIRRKNHEIAIKALKNIVAMGYDNVIYLICGNGVLQGELQDMVDEYGLNKNVIFLGYRNDVSDILKVSDIFIFPSLQEGLPVAVIEAMTSGLPIIASNIRGVSDLITDKKGGYLGNPKSIEFFTNSINKLVKDKVKRQEFGEYNKRNVYDLDISAINDDMKKIYINLKNDNTKH